MVVVEGPDGAGKSTLVKKIVEVCESAVVCHHGTYAELGPLELFRAYQMPMTPARGARELVYDRSWLSEEVYGPIVRGSSRLGRASLDELYRRAEELGCAWVLCLPPYETCRDNWLRRIADEYVGDEVVFRRVYDAYGAVFPPASELIVYDYTRDAGPLIVNGRRILL